MDLLIGLVIATFIIAAVFVGYTASQESSKEIVEEHGTSTEFETLNHAIHKVTLRQINHSF